MNENIDLTNILKDCPKGTKLYSSIYGEIYFEKVCEGDRYPITATTKGNGIATFTKEGLHYADEDGECVLFPSKDQRDWSKWQCPKPKKPKFDPKTLKPFDKVLARHKSSKRWFNDFYSFTDEDGISTVGNGYYDAVIPYNEDTKNLVGTSEEAPEYYKYWED